MRPLCILCQTRPPIQNSHVVPKFVVKRLKGGNPLGTLVYSSDLRRVFQDGWKGDFLCADCEKAFCLLEDWTCKNVYDPFLANGNVSVSYDEKFGLFAASLCFRYIQLAIDGNPQKQMEVDFKKIFENLRANILSNNFNGISSYLYIQFLKPITSSQQFPPGVNTYFFESVDGQCFDYHIPPNDKTWMVYVKLPGLFFILSGSDLKRIFRPPSAVDSHIIGAKGVLDSSSQSGALLNLVSDIVEKRSAEIQVNYSKMPGKRLAKNSAKISALPNKQQYRSHNSFILDQKLMADWQKAKKP
jgi:hypothetical protein